MGNGENLDSGMWIVSIMSFETSHDQVDEDLSLKHRRKHQDLY